MTDEKQTKAPEPDPEHLARFRRVMTALVSVPKSEVIDAFVKKYGNKPMRLTKNGKVESIRTRKSE